MRSAVQLMRSPAAGRVDDARPVELGPEHESHAAHGPHAARPTAVRPGVEVVVDARACAAGPAPASAASARPRPRTRPDCRRRSSRGSGDAERGRDPVGRAHCADRKTTAERLGERHDVRVTPACRAQSYRFGRARIDLVEDEEQVATIGEPAVPRVAGARHDDAALALIGSTRIAIVSAPTAAAIASRSS
jgi:hypothetical protein